MYRRRRTRSYFNKCLEITRYWGQWVFIPTLGLLGVNGEIRLGFLWLNFAASFKFTREDREE